MFLVSLKLIYSKENFKNTPDGTSEVAKTINVHHPVQAVLKMFESADFSLSNLTSWTPWRPISSNLFI